MKLKRLNQTICPGCGMYNNLPAVSCMYCDFDFVRCVGGQGNSPEHPQGNEVQKNRSTVLIALALLIVLPFLCCVWSSKEGARDRRNEQDLQKRMRKAAGAPY